jgi:hypothetical protein
MFKTAFIKKPHHHKNFPLTKQHQLTLYSIFLLKINNGIDFLLYL